MKRQFIFMTMCLLSVSTLLGCQKKEEQDNTEIKYDTSEKIISNSIPIYKIVLPKERSKNAEFAASELVTFFKQSTGATLEVINEDNVVSNGMNHYISLGWTNLAKENNISLQGDYYYGYSGYYIKTLNRNIFITNNEKGDDQGLIYGVYDLLETTIDFKVYADDEIHFDKLDTIYLPLYDKVYIPSFDSRELSYLELSSDKVSAYRLRLYNKSNDNRWGLWGPSITQKHSKLLDYFTYFDEHPDWYSTEGMTAHDQIQLCFTARGDEESYNNMITTLAENIYENHLLKNPNSVYFMLSQADNHSWCRCDACVHAQEEHECKVSGLQIMFFNDVIKKIDELCVKNNDEYTLNRDIRYVLFGYLETIVPSDPTNHPELVADDRLYFMFAPIELDYTKDYATNPNDRFNEYLNIWYKITNGRILLYTYDINFEYFLINFPNFLTYKSHLLTYKKLGVIDYYSQGPVLYYVAGGLKRMRFYVESQLLWNVDQDYDELVYDFMDHYYQDAAAYLKDYYEIIKNRYVYYTQGLGFAAGGIYAKINNSTLWNQGTVIALHDNLLNALKAIEIYKNINPSLYEKLSWRIKEELLSVYYIILSNYQSLYSADVLAEMIDDFHDICDHFSVTRVKESTAGLPF